MFSALTIPSTRCIRNMKYNNSINSSGSRMPLLRDCHRVGDSPHYYHSLPSTQLQETPYSLPGAINTGTTLGDLPTLSSVDNHNSATDSPVVQYSSSPVTMVTL